MLILVRLVVFLVVATVGASFVLYLTTKDRRYLRFAWGLIRFTLVFLLIVAAFYAIERIILII
jgi:hypothetical protein